MCECSCNCNTAPVEPPFTPEQVESAVANASYSYGTQTYKYSLGDGDGGVNWSEAHQTGLTFDTSLGQIKVIEAEGGEGEGDSAHLVIQTVTSGQFFRIDGWYASYDGLYLDGDLREVHETTKTVKVYE